MVETTAVGTLSGFLLARIAEDERAADGDGGTDIFGPVYVEGFGDFALIGAPRLRAECEAKRRIIRFGLFSGQVDSPEEVEIMRTVFAYLALPYADHPDYRDEWRPDGLASVQHGPTADYGEG